MKTFHGTGNEIEWEIVADYYKKCIDCESFIKDETKNMSYKKRKAFIEEHYEYDNCQNHTHLYQIKRAKLWHDSNTNYVYGENIPKRWVNVYLSQR